MIILKIRLNMQKETLILSLVNINETGYRYFQHIL